MFSWWIVFNFFIDWDGERAPRGDRDDYRRRDDGAKKEGASGDFKPEFVSFKMFLFLLIFISVVDLVVDVPLVPMLNSKFK